MDVRELGGLNMLVECLLLLKEPERALTHLNRYVTKLLTTTKHVGECLLLLLRSRSALMHLNRYIYPEKKRSEKERMHGKKERMQMGKKRER
jgi:hypothetical protein